MLKLTHELYYGREGVWWEEGNTKGGNNYYDGGDLANRLPQKKRCSALKTLSHVLCAPVNDFRNRPKWNSHPSVPFDYSTLVLVTFLSNPVLGVLPLFLHRYAKSLYKKEFVQTVTRRHDKNQQDRRWWQHLQLSDFCYLLLIIVCHVIIGTTLILFLCYLPFIVRCVRTPEAFRLSKLQIVTERVLKERNCLVHRKDLYDMCKRRIERFHDYCLTKNNSSYTGIKFPEGVCLTEKQRQRDVDKERPIRTAKTQPRKRPKHKERKRDNDI